jgi:hypothetical protein
MMTRIAAFLVLAMSLSAGDMASTLVHGFEYANAAASDLESTADMKPQVGFNRNNGRLIAVTVTFPQLYETRPLPGLAAMVRRSVISHFQQPPETIVLAFSLGKTPPGTTAQLNALPASEIC